MILERFTGLTNGIDMIIYIQKGTLIEPVIVRYCKLSLGLGLALNRRAFGVGVKAQYCMVKGLGLELPNPNH